LLEEHEGKKKYVVVENVGTVLSGTGDLVTADSDEAEVLYDFL